MPIYEYRCSGCGSVDDYLVGVSAGADDRLACSTCGATQLERLMSRINIGSSMSSMMSGCGNACPMPGGPAASGGSCCGGGCQGH